MLVSSIKTSVQDYYPETIDDTKLGRFIAAAVREYNRWNPLVNTTNITTVDDQQAYAIEGALQVLDCYWYQGSDADDLAEQQMSATLWSDYPPTREVSLPVIRDIVTNSRVNRRKGNWEWRADKLYLFPEPETDGDIVQVNYTSSHLLADEGYATIPDYDKDIIVSLTLAEVLNSALMEQTILGTYATGLTKQAFDPNTTRRRIDELRATVQRYGHSSVIAG